MLQMQQRTTMNATNLKVPEHEIDTEAEDFATEVRRAVNGERQAQQGEQPEHRPSSESQPEPPWQID
jgi:hypothetical protein